MGSWDEKWFCVPDFLLNLQPAPAVNMYDAAGQKKVKKSFRKGLTVPDNVQE